MLGQAQSTLLNCDSSINFRKRDAINGTVEIVGRQTSDNTCPNIHSLNIVGVAVQELQGNTERAVCRITSRTIDETSAPSQNDYTNEEAVDLGFGIATQLSIDTTNGQTSLDETMNFGSQAIRVQVAPASGQPSTAVKTAMVGCRISTVGLFVTNALIVLNEQPNNAVRLAIRWGVAANLQVAGAVTLTITKLNRQ
jgi:hypothetical protein